MKRAVSPPTIIQTLEGETVPYRQLLSTPFTPTHPILINLLSHPVVISTPTHLLTIPPYGPVARLHSQSSPNGHLTFWGVRVPTYTRHSHRTLSLPPPRRNVWFIVSSVVLFAHPERHDLVVPIKFVDDGGVRKACQALAQNPLLKEVQHGEN